MTALAYNQRINSKKIRLWTKVFTNPSVNTGKPTVLMLPSGVYHVSVRQPQKS